MSEQKKNNEIVETNNSFAVLAENNSLSEIMGDDCEGLEFQFDRIKIPAGGGTAFELPSVDGEESEMVKEIKGVILYNHNAYAYYKERYVGGNNPPDCGSFNGVTGIGNPGGSCKDCPFNQFGSGDGKSKLCKNKRLLYILQENELFPIMLSIPTGSLGSFTKYVKGQLSKGRKLSNIVTRISLKKAVNANGIAFSQAVFTFDRSLMPAEIKAIELVVEQVKTFAANLTPANMSQFEDAPFVDAETGEVIEPLQ